MTHTNTTISLALAAALLALGGCDFFDGEARRAERAEKAYQAAMSAYTAGNLDEAVKQFHETLRSNPGNASARFQLACLLQDRAKDYLGALANYREYELHYPKGDKVPIARERAAICERELANALARKFNIAGTVTLSEENAALKKKVEEQTQALAETKKELDALKDSFAASRRENDRLRRLATAIGDDNEPDRPARVEQAVAEAKNVLDDEGTGVDRVKLSADVGNLIAEEKDEDVATPFAPSKPKEPEKKAEPPKRKIPETYVVQEGDTLFKLAERFYGRRAMWSAIRDANKAVIGVDGRLRMGTTIKLP